MSLVAGVPRNVADVGVTDSLVLGDLGQLGRDVLPIGLNRVLDFGLEALPPVQLNGAGDPWEDKDPVPGSCTSNWCPTPGGPLVLSGPIAQHGAYPVCLALPIPVLSPGMAIVLFVLLLVAGAWLMLRRNRATQT